MSGKRFLVVIETQRVKGYVFASPILRETRGASLLLDRLNRRTTRRLLRSFSSAEVDELYLGGGSGRILFHTKVAAVAFQQKLKVLYQRKTVNARVSVEVVERRTGETFVEWMSRGVWESQSNKLARTDAVPFIAGRWIRSCSSCGVEPACFHTGDIQGEHFLCTSCLRKREEVARFYRKTKRNWGSEVPLPAVAHLKVSHPDFILTTLAEKLQDGSGKELKINLPQDFNQIADHSQPRNYIGFIYADGNRMGEAMKEIDRKFKDEDVPKAYTAFSSIVDQATRKAAVHAVISEIGVQQAVTARQEAALFVPAEFVLAGGDDLILVVPAHLALRVAAKFIALFQAYTKQLQTDWIRDKKLTCYFAKQGLTTSAGVVIAHASYPASQLMDLAGGLMKLAKRKASDLAEEAVQDKKEELLEGTLDFMVLHSAGSERSVERRKVEYATLTGGGRSVSLTERPYTATKMEQMLDCIAALKNEGVPRTKLKALYTALFQPALQAQFDALRIKERLKATGQLAENSALARVINELPHFPFREDSTRGGGWTTPLSELIELYDFIPAGFGRSFEGDGNA